jgi:hypothetical protein
MKNYLLDDRNQTMSKIIDLIGEPENTNFRKIQEDIEVCRDPVREPNNPYNADEHLLVRDFKDDDLGSAIEGSFASFYALKDIIDAGRANVEVHFLFSGSLGQLKRLMKRTGHVGFWRQNDTAWVYYATASRLTWSKTVGNFVVEGPREDVTRLTLLLTCHAYMIGYLGRILLVDGDR